jgi:excisionase family DNA binding protein
MSKKIEMNSHNLLNECYIQQGFGNENFRSQLFNNLIWGIDEVSRFTTYSKGTIYNLVSEGDIPYRKRRGRLWFIPNEVLKWLKGEL